MDQCDTAPQNCPQKMRPDRRFAEEIFKIIFQKENCDSLIQNSLKSIP